MKMFNTVLGLGCFCFLLLNYAYASPATTLIGQVNTKECSEKMAKLWLSDIETGLLLYQSDIPGSSSFEVKLKPGKYKIVLNNQKGCFSEMEIEINKNDTEILKEFILKFK